MKNQSIVAATCILFFLGMIISLPRKPVWPDTRVASYDRFARGYLRLDTSSNHDFSSGPEYVVELRIRLVTNNPRPIYMLESENVVSQLRYQTTHREIMIRRTMRYLLSYGCGEGKLVFDVGANEGFYTLLAAAHGCRVLSWEPQPDCANILSYSIAINSYPFTPQLMNKVASSGGTYSIPKSSRCSGTKSFVGAIAGDDIVESVSIDAARKANGPVYIMHMDVEGAEVLVLESANHALRDTENFIVEVNPGRWNKYGVTRERGLGVFAALRGFECRDLAIRETHPLNIPVLQNLAESVAAIPGETDYWCTRLRGLEARTQPTETRMGPDRIVRPGYV